LRDFHLAPLSVPTEGYDIPLRGRFTLAYAIGSPNVTVSASVVPRAAIGPALKS